MKEKTEKNKEILPGSSETTEINNSKNKTEELEKNLEEEKNRYLRLLADFSNYKKKIEAEKGEILKFANEAFILALLPVIDNFERAVNSAEKMQNPSAEELIKGIALVKKQLEDNLEKLGVKVIEAVGKPFDPHFHEAALKKKSQDQPEHTILEEMQKGYLLYDKVIRPAMVIISEKEEK